MSLLLDALKKAEKDKQKAREAEAAGSDIDVQEIVQENTAGDQVAVDPLEIVDKKEAEPDQAPEVENTDEELELVLDEQASEIEETTQESAEEELEVDEPQLAPPLALEKIAATTSTVSDEALQLLVYKTNKRHRQRQKVVWGSLLSATLFILVTAAAYNYYGMLEEVDALESKHQLAMRAVRAEPVKRHRVVEQPKAEAVNQASQEETRLAPGVKHKAISNAIASSVEKRRNSSQFSIEKTKKTDPINTLLQAAWLAYNRADYQSASQAYTSVLEQEPNNRDALLGVAAVAVKAADYQKAKASYQLLLKLDPRDQLAIAALTNIEEMSSDELDESNLKFMLQQQPASAHLNFALGNSYAKKGQWPEAQSAYFKAWKNSSGNADYVFNLAVSLDQLGKSKQALNFYKQSLTLANEKNVGFSKSAVEKRIDEISSK